MKEKAVQGQLRSLSDRDNPSQEHTQTLGKVKRQYQNCMSQRTCGTCSSSCEHWSHGSTLCHTVMNSSSVWPSLQDTPLSTSSCSPSTSPCTHHPRQKHSSLLQQVFCSSQAAHYSPPLKQNSVRNYIASRTLERLYGHGIQQPF